MQQHLLNPGNYVAVRLQQWGLASNARRLMGYKMVYTDKLVQLHEEVGPAGYYFDVPVAWETICVQD